VNNHHQRIAAIEADARRSRHAVSVAAKPAGALTDREAVAECQRLVRRRSHAYPEPFSPGEAVAILDAWQRITGR
jgi:hypothetical protein